MARKWQPKILINRTDKVVEFQCGGQIFIHKPGFKVTYDGFVADHALNDVNTGLEEYSEEMEAELEESLKKDQPDYRALRWQQLVKKAAKVGVFERGMGKQDIIQALEQSWQEKYQPKNER